MFRGRRVVMPNGHLCYCLILMPSQSYVFFCCLCVVLSGGYSCCIVMFICILLLTDISGFLESSAKKIEKGKSVTSVVYHSISRFGTE